MSKSAANEDQELDEHGLVVHTYVSTVLVVVPSERYAETTLRYARSALYNVHVGTHTVSTVEDRILHGELQDELQADGLLKDASLDDHSGILFCGGPGALELAQDPDAQRLAREAFAQDKLVGAWGEAVLILGRAGVLKKRKVTADRLLAKELAGAGAKVVSHQVVVDKKLVTSIDDSAGLRFGKALVQLVRI